MPIPSYLLSWTLLIQYIRQSLRVSAIKNAPARTTSPAVAPKAQPSANIKNEAPLKQAPTRLGSSYPAIRTSSIDVDAKPMYEPNGKPITEIDMDAGTLGVLIAIDQ